MPTDAKHTRSKRRLGRGLSSLIGGSIDATAEVGQYEPAPASHTVAPETRQTTAVPTSPPGPHEIPTDQISPNPFQPRRQFSDADLQELTDSVARPGILQPLIVAPASDAAAARPYVLIAGERRLRAAQKAGLAAVPCVLRDATPQQMLEWALVENIQRADLNPVERANAYHEFMDRFALSQTDAAERLGQPRATIANYLRILDLHSVVQQLLSNGALSFGHAKVLAGLISKPDRQIALAKQVAAGRLSVRQLEGLVAAACADERPAADRPARPHTNKPPYLCDLEDQLTRTIGTRVTIQPGRAKHAGKLVIEYYNLDDFDRIAAMLGHKTEG